MEKSRDELKLMKQINDIIFRRCDRKKVDEGWNRWVLNRTKNIKEKSFESWKEWCDNLKEDSIIKKEISLIITEYFKDK